MIALASRKGLISSLIIVDISTMVCCILALMQTKLRKHTVNLQQRQLAKWVWNRFLFTLELRTNYNVQNYKQHMKEGSTCSGVEQNVFSNCVPVAASIHRMGSQMQ
jgi:hypothetical protein